MDSAVFHMKLTDRMANAADTISVIGSLRRAKTAA